MNKFMRKIYLPFLSILFAATPATLLQAEEIEIYLTASSDVIDDSIRPNLMFLLDTSGSMTGRIAVEVPAGAETYRYDQDVTYGASPSNYIYVYNSDFEYQNAYFTTTQSVCKAWNDHFVAFPGAPSFAAKAVQWQAITTTETIETTDTVCEDVPSGAPPINGNTSGSVNNNQWRHFGPFPVETGSQISATLTSPSNQDRFALYVRFDNQPARNNYACRANNIRNGSGSCNVVAGNTNSTVYISILGARNNSDYQLTYGITGGVNTVCTDIVTETEVTVSTSNWTTGIGTNTTPAWVVECQNDRGDHGINNSSSLDYVRNCGSNDCAEPLYSSRRQDEINWSSVPTNVYVSPNYHDFIQAFGPPDESIALLPTGNVATTCNSQGSGYQFSDDGVVYECQRKTDVLKDTMSELLSSLTGVNIGLAQLSGSNGGFVREAIRPIDGMYNVSTTVRDRYLASIATLPADAWTPLTESLWEMMLYFQGATPLYGAVGGADAAARSDGAYVTPIQNHCQSNNVILLTDGEPTEDSGRDAAIRTLSGQWCQSTAYSTTTAGSCLDELAGYMAGHDMSAAFPGNQSIRTYTIGFAIDIPLLEGTATAGNGTYFSASNAIELRTAFTNILIDVLAESSTFVAPAVSVNAFNQLQNRNEVYFAIFQPNNSPRWAGNVKKFVIQPDGTLLDRNGRSAIDPNTGFFADSAQDFWSSTIDGNTVTRGGIVERMPATRRVFTSLTSSPNNLNLVAGGNTTRVATNNAGITREVLGLPAWATNSQRDNLILWGAGFDVYDEDGNGITNEPNRFVGDPLFSRPMLVTYGGTAAQPNDVLYVTTNLGFLHAIDGATGEEIWSWAPGDLLDNLQRYQQGDSMQPKAYGLDGEMSVWIYENPYDTDVDIDVTDGDFVYLYMGMRRGGQNYYAMDVTSYHPTNWNSISPILKWQINGGTGQYGDMGQSWSRMIKTKVAWQCGATSCDERDVVFFSGGYDLAYDNATEPVAGTMGNAVYMVDAHTGELLWSAGNNSDARNSRNHNVGLADMNYSIPGSPNPVDVDGDDLADVMFVTDIAGQVWRFDFAKDTTNASNFASGGMIYDLNSDGEFRRFYNQPDVVLSAPRGGDAYFNLVFGSGYMARPRDATQDDSIFILFHDDVFAPPRNEDDEITYETRDVSDLFAPRASNEPANKYTNAPYGYYIPLNGNGEKMVRSGLIFQNVITYTSYLPEGNTSAYACSDGELGGARLYRIDLTTGENLIADEESAVDEDGEPLGYIELARPGIAPEGTIIFLEDGVVLCIATECSEAGQRRMVERVYWREEDPDVVD